ncbi:hypothetical protein EON63_22990 [archaeon]|nr:MAG: hypothetical protein EON63_22990 [archaeon]
MNPATTPPKIECTFCKVQRPISARHCYDCGVCIDGLDHHCPWTGKCIGNKLHTSYIMHHILYIIHHMPCSIRQAKRLCALSTPSSLVCGCWWCMCWPSWWLRGLWVITLWTSRPSHRGGVGGCSFMTVLDKFCVCVCFLCVDVDVVVLCEYVCMHACYDPQVVCTCLYVNSKHHMYLFI